MVVVLSHHILSFYFHLTFSGFLSVFADFNFSPHPSSDHFRLSYFVYSMKGS